MGTNHVVVDAAAVDVADVADATAAIAVVAVAAGLALVPVAAAKWQQYVGTCTVLVFVPAVFHPISHQQPLTGAIYSPISGKNSYSGFSVELLRGHLIKEKTLSLM